MDVGLWTWALLVSAVGSVSLPDITDRSFIKLCVENHNRARSKVYPAASDMLYMSWDEGLAVTARAWARHCVFKHNPNLKDASRVHPTFPSVGENIYVGSSLSLYNVTNIVQKWVNEEQYYSYSNNKCSNVCGHYTQVVWASSYKVGCAVHWCPDGIKQTDYDYRNGVNFVCNYAPAGNMEGMKPYRTNGNNCLDCKGICEKKLCRNKERDAEKSYTWSPDWEIVPSAAHGQNYIDVLIIRPVAVIYTFISAFVDMTPAGALRGGAIMTQRREGRSSSPTWLSFTGSVAPLSCSDTCIGLCIIVSVMMV